MCSHPLHGLFITAGLISALAAINIGAVAFGWDFFTAPMVVEYLHRYLNVVRYIVGIAGIIKLIGVAKWIAYPCHCK
ncbi:hypothetical protein M1446_00640 [Candidatus Dependentiae bacterium]|nr:hypothetical protein [Candidatus Dependentiae bacterium]